MGLHIEIGDQLDADVQRVVYRSVRFVTEDGRTMFEVSACKDGRGIEIRGVQPTKVGGVLLDNLLDVRPTSANCVLVIARPYEGT